MVVILEDLDAARGRQDPRTYAQYLVWFLKGYPFLTNAQNRLFYRIRLGLWSIAHEGMTPSMPPKLADNLIVVMPRGMSLSDWNRIGLLDREWALYRALASSFGNIVLVTYGARSDLELAARLKDDMPSGVGLLYIWNDQRLSEPEYWGGLPDKLVHELSGSQSSLVRTHQLSSGSIAVDIRDALRTAGHRVSLLTRGGYLWSRFAAQENGPHSASAQGASLAEQALCKAAEVVVGTTQEMVTDLCWRYMLDPTRAFVVPNFAFFDESKPVASTEREKGLIVCSGRLSARKRVRTLIEAMTKLPDDLKTQARLEVIGDGAEMPALVEAAATSGVRVECVGVLQHEQVLERLARCSIYAKASELEGHPKGVIDAMAAGAVVVVADSPGLGTMVTNGVTGIMVPGGDADGFANAFMGLLNDDDWREMLGSAAARFARTELGLGRVVALEIEACKAAMSLAEPTSLAA
ncbi:glycosyltransferase [bacterium]|nr:MAG: glycosyltransferase [bacterium]